VWSGVTGLVDSPIWDELATFAQQYPRFQFQVFNQANLSRSYGDIDETPAP